MKALTTFFFAFAIISCSSVSEKQEAIDRDVYAAKDQNTDTVAHQTPLQEGVPHKPDVSVKTYALDNINIIVTQKCDDGIEFYCHSIMIISRNNTVIDSLFFASEPLGGDFGIAEPLRLKDHLIFTKHGDYDGRTIIINSRGEVFNIIGGQNYYDTDKGMLFTLYESDLGGFAVFDLKNEELKIVIQDLDDYPVSFHKAFGGKYYLLLEVSEPEETDRMVWEVKPEAGRVVEVDLDQSHFTSRNMLKTWRISSANCGF